MEVLDANVVYNLTSYSLSLSCFILIIMHHYIYFSLLFLFFYWLCKELFKLKYNVEARETFGLSS